MKKTLLLILGCLTITFSYSNERSKSKDTLNSNPFGLEESSTVLNGYSGENTDNLSGYEDYTNYKGVDYTGYNKIEDLQEENRNKEISNVLSPFISFLMPLGFYLLYKLLKKMIIIANESE